jgi:hypothetical protein
VDAREPAPGTREPTDRTVWAGWLTITEALILVGFFAFYVYEMATGATDDLVRAGTSGALILVFGVFLALTGRAWLQGAGWPRTPTIVWNVLLLPVAWSLHESDRTLIAVGVAALAGLTIAAAVAAAPADDRADHRDEVS